MTVNQSVFDATVRHQILVQRLGATTANSLIRLIEQAEPEVQRKIAARLRRLGPLDRQVLGRGQATTRRLVLLDKELRVLLRDLHKVTGRKLRADLRNLTKLEADIAATRVDEAVGVDLMRLRPSADSLNAIVTAQPLRGRVLRQLVADMSTRQRADTMAAVRLGLLEGETIPQIQRRVRQATNVTKRRAEILARTSVNHVTNRSREALYKANEDVVDSLRWTATLDGRTSAICSARDGLVFKVNKGPRPPAHPNCRSVMTPVLKSWDALNRGAPLKPGRGARTVDKLFRDNLKRRGFAPSAIKTIKRATRASMNGQVPDALTYQKWLERQPAGFQDEVLGKTRGALFRRGGLTLDKFVDMRSGRQFDLAQLRAKESAAFMRANVE